MDSKDIKKHMKVVGSDNVQLGMVDHMEGDRAIKLTKDKSGTHHFIPMQWVSSIDDKIHLDRSCKDALTQWSERPSLS